MASIERTAYPRFKRNYSKKELQRIYTPSLEETHFLYSIARGSENLLAASVLLKSFQRLGYFPKAHTIPKGIVEHIHDSLNLPPDLSLGFREQWNKKPE